MSAFRRMFALVLVCLAGSSVAQVSDQTVAARVLGPHWKQMARTSGMIFSGTVVGVEAQPAGKGRPLPLILTKFRVNRGIVGVRDGEVLSIREWVGAWSSHHAMRRGQRILVFLYPPSRLGLTSPVGGHLGQVMLDSRGEIAAANNLQDHLLSGADQTSAAEAAINLGHFAARVNSCPPQDQLRRGVSPQGWKRCSSASPNLHSSAAVTQAISILTHLERAIRNARGNPSAPPSRIKE